MNDSKNFFKAIRDDGEGAFSSNGTVAIPLGGNRVRFNGLDYGLSPAILTAFTDTKGTFTNFDMDDESVLFFDKIQEGLDYDHPKNSKL